LCYQTIIKTARKRMVGTWADLGWSHPDSAASVTVTVHCSTSREGSHYLQGIACTLTEVPSRMYAKVILRRINLEGNTHAQESNASQLPV
jgi:hypothetical protein